VIPAFEDVTRIIDEEQRWPENFDPLKLDLKAPDERRRVAKLIERGLGEAAGHVLPLKALPPAPAGTKSARRFRSSPWPLRREHLYLIPGDSPLGLRLPLASLPWVAPGDKEEEFERDPFEELAPLATPAEGEALRLKVETPAVPPKASYDPHEIVHTALCAEVRDGVLCIFLPPVPLLEDFVTLLEAIEATAADLKLPVRLEGYTPPSDPRLKEFRITPDPGVIEVNIHPAAGWQQLVDNTTRLYEEARLTRLGTEKFMLDGRHTGTGGGNHITLGAATPADSPCLRRPDLLMSLITYWQHHPGAVLPVLRHVHRPHQPGAARRRGAPRKPLRTGNRLPADGRAAQARRGKPAALAGRPPAAQPAGRSLRQHAPRRVLHRQAVFARRRRRTPRPGRVPRLRDAAARADVAAADAAAARAGGALLADALPAAAA
jgi:uncharacterized protein (DUF2126 family)